jgi:hypothetical protein
VIVRNLGDGRLLHAVPATTTAHRPESLESVDSIVVKPDGAVAWIAQTRSIIGRGAAILEVHRLDIRGQSLLDVGRSIEARSLRLSGSTVSWQVGAVIRKATLR